MHTPSADYCRTAYRVPERPLKGLDSAMNWGIGIYERRGARRDELTEQAERVEAFAKDYAELKDHGLQERLFQFRDHFRREAKPGGEVLLLALAAIREAAEEALPTAVVRPVLGDLELRERPRPVRDVELELSLVGEPRCEPPHRQEPLPRLHRPHPGKRDACIYDYVDAEVPVLRRMFAKRARSYRAMSYAVDGA